MTDQTDNHHGPAGLFYGLAWLALAYALAGLLALACCRMRPRLPEGPASPVEHPGEPGGLTVPGPYSEVLL